MTTNHTPGNWTVGKTGGTVVSDQPLPNYSTNGGHDHVDYYGGHLIAESIWRAEDARLIAAAPELLEALEWALRAMEARNPLWAEGERFIAARAAIAKAKGEQQ
ncbi:hypothetical protein ACOTDT_17000 [Achromobacter xylosoxidans]|uniref:hypothetical protein n=1 Tax=Alcaligenes xylosoxydans xylosoxydans TaxID=85698 RepID=UPI001F0D7B60|nr:hypothetical protein [Achromobacter xylosoxidans]MCH4572223.1 hypothetical protein [Achromobacter xylosoxidans]